MAFKFFDKVYKDWYEVCEGAMRDYPEYTANSDDALDFIEMHIEDIDDEEVEENLFDTVMRMNGNALNDRMEWEG